MRRSTAIPKVLFISIVVSCGSGNGNKEKTGEDYKTVTIGNQIWMAENLNINYFRNNMPVPLATTAAEWKKAGENKQPACCYFKFDPAYGSQYGKLYNWYAVKATGVLAPKGWRIANDQDWTILTAYLGGDSIAGKKIKSTRTWETTGGTNESGFNGLGAGYCDHTGYCGYLEKATYWWTSTSREDGGGYARFLFHLSESIDKDSPQSERGFYIRCIKD